MGIKQVVANGKGAKRTMLWAIANVIVACDMMLPGTIVQMVRALPIAELMFGVGDRLIWLAPFATRKLLVAMGAPTWLTAPGLIGHLGGCLKGDTL